MPKRIENSGCQLAEEAKNKELKIKNEKMKTNKARDDKTSGRKTPEKVKQGGRTTSANNVRIHK